MEPSRRCALVLLAAVSSTGPSLGLAAGASEAMAQSGEPLLPPIPRLSLRPEIAAKVGRQVWLNESGGRAEGVTAWNDGEDFPSLGIGHFIWFKAGGNPLFEESFPKLVEYMRDRGARPPAWLDRRPIPPCPWQSKAEFERDFRSPRMLELRRYLLDSVPQQTQYLLARTEAAIPRMLATLPDRPSQTRLLVQLGRVVRASPDLYPLIDYVNFKGEGISEKETMLDSQTGRNQGWGLKWLLLEMTGNAEGQVVLGEFSEAAKTVLDRRIRNHPPSARWRAGWHKRCDTYRKPLA